jgi:hypothetical protein
MRTQVNRGRCGGDINEGGEMRVERGKIVKEKEEKQKKRTNKTK